MAVQTGLNEEIKVAILDCETTGLSVTEDRIIQIAILILNQGRPLKLFDSYFKPGHNVDLSKSYHIHHISSDVIKNAPSFEAKADEIIEILANVDIIAGHNITFDFEFLRNEFNRVDQAALPTESESDETWQTVKKLKSVQHEATKVKEFDGLKFRLLDTFRLALIAFPSQQSYSLSALAKFLRIQVKYFETTGYKWVSKSDTFETIIDVNERVEFLKEHNAINDILQTEKLLTECLKVLNISYVNVLDGKCERFEINRQLVLAANKLMEKKLATNEELVELVKLAPDQMNINFPERSKCFRDMNAADIKGVIVFLSNRPSHSNKRQKLICQGFLQLALDKEQFNLVRKELDEKKEKELQQCSNKERPERFEKVDAISNEDVDKCDEMYKDGEEVTDKKQHISANEGDVDIPSKIARFDKEEESIANETAIHETNSYEDETEEYEISYGNKNIVSSKENPCDNCESSLHTKDCVKDIPLSEQHCSSMSEREDSWSESILARKDNTRNDESPLSSQEYPIRNEGKITPEKDSKREEKMKKMRMFSPVY